MVAKLHRYYVSGGGCLNLAKIHMVAKRRKMEAITIYRLNLAKIHMVAKLAAA